MECKICKSVSGEMRISPGPLIYEGKFWIVDHAYPSKLKGWLVVVAKRHVEALHELTSEEFSELAVLCEKSVKFLRELLDCEKEYVMCLAEKEHFHHIHFHIVPKPFDLPEDLKGAKIFAMLKVEEKEAVTSEAIIEISSRLKNKFNNN